MLRTTVNSHESALGELRTEMLTLDKQKADVEGTLSALHCKVDNVMGERDDLALHLDQAVKELESIRVERNDLVAKVADISIVQNPPDNSFNTLDVADSELERSLNEDQFDNPFREILNLSCISEEDFETLNTRMSQAKSIIAQIEGERTLLKKEVKHLRVGLENAQEELATAKEDYKKISHQTLALRDVVSQARSLLEKTEEEKNNLTLDLENAQKAMKRIQRNSSESYNVIVAQSQDEIIKLKMELKQKHESIKLLTSSSIERANATIDSGGSGSHNPNKISKYDISSETVVATNQHTDNNNTPKVMSKERFKVERGSMFGMLKDMKKSGRKDKVKYRKVEEK
mmetsp:Transcript_34400/g.63282  ORF Transcript_34400/g.63282 Transcript_34400/m.63282 type:complete len:345 (-) Transcript_34400:53-1087(-)